MTSEHLIRIRLAIPTMEQENADLQRQVAELEETIRDHEQDLLKAAHFGKSLLEQNEDLQCRIDDLLKQHATAMEEKQQEVCSLQSRCEVQACTEKWQQEEINSLRAELQNIRQTLTDELAQKQHSEISAYRNQLEMQRLDLEQLQGVEQELRNRNSELESLLQSHLDRTQINSMSISVDSEEIATLQQELLTVRMDMTELQAKTIDLTGKVQQLQCERDTLTNRLAVKSTETEELEGQIMSYVSHLEQARSEASELRAQLDSAKVEGQQHKSKGNSIFSELEDRRLKVERKMTSLRINHQQLKEKYEFERRQNLKYRMQIASALQMASDRHDEAMFQRLRSQVNDAHAEIRTLSAQLQKNSTAEQPSSLACPANMDEKNYTEYLMTVIRSEREAADDVRRELQSKTLQYLDVTNQNMELSRQAQRLDAEKDKLQAALLKMTLEKEELQLTYEPEKVEGGRVQRTVVEKIDLGDRELQRPGMLLPLGLAARRQSDLFRANAALGRPSNVFKVPATARASGAFKSVASLKKDSRRSQSCTSVGAGDGHETQAKTMAVDQDSTLDLQDLTLGTADNPTSSEDKENLGETNMDCTFTLLHGRSRKVVISDTVKVVGADGEETFKALSEEDNGSGNLEPTKKKKEASTVRKVKHVNFDEVPQADCKQQ